MDFIRCMIVRLRLPVLFLQLETHLHVRMRQSIAHLRSSKHWLMRTLVAGLVQVRAWVIYMCQNGIV